MLSFRSRGCIVETPLNFWHSNLTQLNEDNDIKLTSSCQKTRKGQLPCMSKIGVPVMKSVVFGGLSCDAKVKVPDPCGSCAPSARALMLTFLLNNNEKYVRVVFVIMVVWC
jgi:hypothetical protein